MNILTIDLEEWFHAVFESDSSTWKGREVRIYKNTEFIIEALKEANVKATFFCVGWIARNYPDLISRINREGFEFGSHSDYHNVAYKLSKNDFFEDVTKSIDSLESLTGRKIKIFRAPYFSITRHVADYIEVLANCGIDTDCSICPCETKYGGFKNFPVSKPCVVSYGDTRIRELPLSSLSFFNKTILYSGGGYFRLLPYSVIKALFGRQSYNMTYFHPRDFDGTQPGLGLSYIEDLRRNIGAKGAGKKFKKLLSAFDFTDVSTASKSINWNTIPVINLKPSVYENSL